MSETFKIGEVILGKYKIIDLISEGGQAFIAKGIELKTCREVAIKKLLAAPKDIQYHEELARFQRAAKLRINHPNVVDPIDYGVEKKQHYIIMSYIEGKSLQLYLQSKGGKISVDEAVSITIASCQGLEAIHSQGVVHRDLKPDNIIITPDNQVRIIDLGLSKVLDQQTVTEGEKIIGTLVWMAPEQVAQPGTEDSRTDLYVSGAILYYLLTKQIPVQGNAPAAIALSICQHTPPAPSQLNPSIPSHIDQVCMKMMAKQREHRFQTAAECVAALQGQNVTPQAGLFCQSCSSRLQLEHRFCSNCGASSQISSSIRCLACGSNAGHVSSCPKCNRRFSPSDHRIFFSRGSLSGITFRIPEGSFLVGRNELSQRDYHISRKHLLVVCSNGTVTLEDVGSANKTYVNNNQVTCSAMLNPQSRIDIAGNTATYNHS